jgi:hypothetical protein
VRKQKMFSFLLLCLVWAGVAGAHPEESETGITPPPGETPVPVQVGIYLIDLTNIDETRNTFDVELDVQVRWTDSRMAFDPEAAGTDRRVHVGPEAEKFFDGLWTAQIVLANPVGQMGIGARKVTVHSDGRMEISVQVNSTVRTNLDYRRFPFDSQVLPIILESFAWNNTVVELVPDPDWTGFAPEFSLAEWDVKALDSSVVEVLRVRDVTPFSNINYEIRIQRQSGYYLWKIFLTVIIIVSLTFVVFWMSDERLGRRAGVSSSGILTVIAYQFVTTSTLPRVSYLTVADLVMTVSIITIAATMVVSVFVDRIGYENNAAQIRVDRACRWIFPLTYLGMLSLVIGLKGVF